MRYVIVTQRGILDILTGAIARTWGTTPEERALVFPGDRAEDTTADRLWRGVDIDAPAEIAFRWLCQLRAAPYSYDWIDNGGRRSPRTYTWARTARARTGRDVDLPARGLRGARPANGRDTA